MVLSGHAVSGVMGLVRNELVPNRGFVDPLYSVGTIWLR